ncbi:MAG: hypothetical protein QXG08_03590 [Candidatus Methanomethyliaceae archaeon]
MGYERQGHPLLDDQPAPGANALPPVGVREQRSPALWAGMLLRDVVSARDRPFPACWFCAGFAFTLAGLLQAHLPLTFSIPLFLYPKSHLPALSIMVRFFLNVLIALSFKRVPTIEL